MTAEVVLRYLLAFLAGVTFGASVLYALLRGFLAGVGRAMPFRNEQEQRFPPVGSARSLSRR